jgi:hypothetical protein
MAVTSSNNNWYLIPEIFMLGIDLCYGKVLLISYEIQGEILEYFFCLNTLTFYLNSYKEE